jgi:hypothetical protein
MTRSEAELEAKRLQAEHPDRRFVARESAGGDWEVASVLLPKDLQRGPLTPTIESGPRPSPGEDPRSGHERRVPGIPGGLG